MMRSPEFEFDPRIVETARKQSYRNLPYNAREFIAWDGEGIKRDDSPELYQLDGSVFSDIFYNPDEHPARLVFDYEFRPQPYVTLANSEGGRIISTDPEGLNTVECFEFLLDEKQKYPKSIFVGFGLSYDWNQMIRNFATRHLEQIYETNWATFGPYRIKMVPKKELLITTRFPVKRSVKMYDVFGFFQSSFIDACEKYLGKDDPRLALIRRGKEARDVFKYEELDEFIIPYNNAELAMLVDMMNILREDLHKVDITPTSWHGPGAVAQTVFRHHHIPITRDIPEEVLDASQFAYQGGRFEQFAMGHHPHTVYEYDIRSAYPAAAIHLPDLSAGSWEHVQTYEPGSFGVWFVSYKSADEARPNGLRPQPLFCRSQNGSISYPTQTDGWYWSPEAALVHDYVLRGYVFRPSNDSRPFNFIKEMYEQRRLFKYEGNSAERALKLILNSIYGKLAQKVGGKDGPPSLHQLEYAGYITSYTRAKIYRAIQLNPEGIIAAETDAVFSRYPLDLPLSEELGAWELKEHSAITYLQSGFYYVTDKDGNVTSKYRGMDKDKTTGQPDGLPEEKVLHHYRVFAGHPHEGEPMCARTKRFIALGLALHTSSIWRSWENKERIIQVDYNPAYYKRYHSSPECELCQDKHSMADGLHPMYIGGYFGPSYATKLPWRSIEMEEEFTVEDNKFFQMEDHMRWQ